MNLRSYASMLTFLVALGCGGNSTTEGPGSGGAGSGGARGSGGSGAGGSINCTDIAILSVDLTLLDEDGAPVSGAQVRYSVDGGETQYCESWNDGSYQCGYEEAGEFAFVVDAAGYELDEFTQTVEQGECHVGTERVERTLVPTPPATCTTIAMTSVVVPVDPDDVDAEMQVLWSRPGTAEAPQPCETADRVTWSCGVEARGDIRVDIPASAGHDDYTRVVTVEADACHVHTVTLDEVQRPWLPD